MGRAPSVGQRLSLGAVALAFAAMMGIASACGGDGGGEATIEEYLTQYEEIDNTAEVASDELDADYEDVLSQTQLTDENRPDVQAYFEELGEVGQEYVDDLSDLNPPDEAQDIHDASIASYQEVLDLYEEARAGIGQATSIGELQALFSTPDINAALAAANADCAALQQFAGESGVDVDFECQGAAEGTPPAD